MKEINKITDRERDIFIAAFEMGKHLREYDARYITIDLTEGLVNDFWRSPDTWVNDFISNKDISKLK